jgi:hypothetical protein
MHSDITALKRRLWVTTDPIFNSAYRLKAAFGASAGRLLAHIQKNQPQDQPLVVDSESVLTHNMSRSQRAQEVSAQRPESHA